MAKGYRHLDLAERRELHALWGAGLSQQRIAEVLGRSASTVSRELKRNHSSRHGTKHGVWSGPGSTRRRGRYAWGYLPYRAQQRTDARARRPKVAKLSQPGLLRDAVIAKLRDTLSPEQIAAELRLEHPGNPEMQVSHETIYQAFYLQSRGGLRELLGREVLRRGHYQRIVRRKDTGCGRGRRRLSLLKISARPAEAADRAVPGHWEGDLLMGARNASAIGTLVERSTRYVMLVHLPDQAWHDPARFADLAAEAMLTLPAHLRRSLTWDRGLEMVNAHAQFSLATQLPVYFCDPHSPWQRGSNENTNGLLRQFFRKGTDLSTHTQDDLDRVSALLNRRPRKTLQWDTPAKQLNQLLLALAA